MFGLVWYNSSELPPLSFSNDAIHFYSIGQTEPPFAVGDRIAQCFLLLPSLCLVERKRFFQVCHFGWTLVVVFRMEKTQMNDASCAVVVGGNGMIFTTVVAAVTVVVDAIVEGSM